MPRAGLSPERVIAEAELLADEVGLPDLTLSGLADRLGVRMPSLYRHIDGLAALHRALAIRARLELAAVLARATAGRSGPGAVLALATAYRTWATDHPGRYAATIAAPDPGDTENLAASSAAVDLVADVLGGFGLTGDDAVDAIRALRATMHGFITLEHAGGFGLPADRTHSYLRAVTALTTAWSAPDGSTS